MIQTAPQDTVQQGLTTAYDSVWANQDVPTAVPEGIETVMLADDKLFVVLAVVLVIWFGMLFVLFRTDRKLDRLAKTLPDDPS